MGKMNESTIPDYTPAHPPGSLAGTDHVGVWLTNDDWMCATCAKAQHTSMLAALRAQSDLLLDAQRYITAYLEPSPGGIIQSEQTLVSTLIELFDGPRQRDVKAAVTAAIAAAEQE